MAADVIIIYNRTSAPLPLGRGITLAPGRSRRIFQRELVAFPYFADDLAKNIRAGTLSASTDEGEVLTPIRMRALARGIHAHTHDEVAGVDPLDLSGESGGAAMVHRKYRQLIHFIDDGPALGFPSGSYREELPAGDPFPTSIVWWESVTKLKKIVSLDITRAATQEPVIEVWCMYGTDGATILEQVTDTVVYDGPFEVSRTRNISVPP